MSADDHRPAASSLDGAGERWMRADTLLAAGIALLGAAVYANAVGGTFVYDDLRQIVQNDLILQGRHFWRAMVSDVWAFKRGAGEAASNYWRPTFVLWLIANHRLFGLQPAGWHLANLALHAAVIVMAFRLLRQLAVPRPLVGAILVIFAVHPVHVESVAWISGSPDLLLSVLLLGSLSCVVSGLRAPSGRTAAFAVALYAVALLAKEAAVLYPAIVFVTVYALAPGSARTGSARIDPARIGPARIARALKRSVPFVVVAAAYLVVRGFVLGGAGLGAPVSASLADAMLSAPSVAAFYLRQMIFPWWLGPSYPLRVVAGLDWRMFILPLIVVTLAGHLMLRAARGHPVRAIGLALFAFPLAPAFNVGAFFPEHIVHDRYLYLPLLGALMVLVPVVADLVARLTGGDAARAGRWCLGLAVLAGVPLAAQTIRYNAAWRTDLALWELGVRVDPSSSFNHHQHGVFLHEAGRAEEAVAAFDRALAIRTWANPYLGRAEALTDLGRYGEAEADLRTAIERHGDLLGAYERLAVCYERQERFGDAARTLRDARTRLPERHCMLTDMLAVVLHRDGRSDEAMRELEAARPRVADEFGAAARLVHFHLGMLYAEKGRGADARRALRDYLDASAAFRDPVTTARRRDAQTALARLGG